MTRAYLATVRMAATSGIGEHPLVFLDHAISLLRVVLIVAIWRAVLGAAGATEAGSVATRLLRPVSMFGDYIAEMAGGWALRWVTFSIPVLGLTPLLRVSVAPASGLRAAAFVLSVMLSITVGVAVDFLFGLLVVRFSENAYALRLARDGMTPLLSGAVIPLPLLPWGLGGVLAWLPLASMVAAPLRIYTGDGDVIALLSRQAGWAVFLWVVTRPAWRRTAVRMVSFGG